LSEFDIDQVWPTAVLLDREHSEVVEGLRTNWVVREVDLRNAVELVVEKDRDVGFVHKSGRAAKVMEPQPASLDAFLVGGDDRNDRDLVFEGEVLQRFGDPRYLLTFVRRLGSNGDLLQVVDEEDDRSALEPFHDHVFYLFKAGVRAGRFHEPKEISVRIDMLV